jgi:hypothetical protein
MSRFTARESSRLQHKSHGDVIDIYHLSSARVDARRSLQKDRVESSFKFVVCDTYAISCFDFAHKPSAGIHNNYNMAMRMLASVRLVRSSAHPRVVSVRAFSSTLPTAAEQYDVVVIGAFVEEGSSKELLRISIDS